jgi:hypothetical protein
MSNKNLNILPAPPRIFKTMVAGFDTLTNHIYLILLPIGLDLLLWFSPRLRLKALIDAMIGDFLSQSLRLTPDLETRQVLISARDLWELVGEHFNLLLGLRSYPIGIPSLMVSVLPLEMPLGKPIFVEINSLILGAGLFLLFSVLGLFFGTLYFHAVAQAATSENFDWGKILTEWPSLSVQVVFLALTWLGLLAGVSIPASCIISMAALSSMAFGQCAVLLYSGFLIWIIFPLLFSGHGIFINKQSVWDSIKQGIYITRLTLPTTSLFFLSVFLLTQVMDLLWRIPPENSWLMLVSLAGHAFVNTGLLSASFIYYREADHWIRGLQNINSQGTPINRNLL